MPQLVQSTFDFGPGNAWLELNSPMDGSTVAVVQPRQFDILQSFNIDFDLTEKPLWGGGQYPVALAISEGKCTGKIVNARFNPGEINAALFGEPVGFTTGTKLMSPATTGVTPIAAVTVGGVTAAITLNTTALTLSGSITGLTAGMALELAGAGASGGNLFVTLASGATTSWVTSSPALTTITTGAVTAFPSITITPPSSGTYLNDWGVRFSSSGLYLTALGTNSTALASGNYLETLGVYSFATADAAKGMLTDYEYSVTTGSQLDILSHLQGQVALSSIRYQGNYGGRYVGIYLPNTVGSKFTIPVKQKDWTLPEIDFQAFTDSANNLAYMYISSETA